MKKNLFFSVGTRPEAIKLAPLILAAKDAGFSTTVLSTGQHREMLIPILNFFKIVPDIHLDVLKPNQSLADLTASILSKTHSALQSLKPDLVFVQGDTTTATATALAAFYEKLPVVHIEAGLRTLERYSPFPEEMNRCLISQLASFHFAPTEVGKQNLANAGITEKVWVTGNTGIDALRISSALLEGQKSAFSETGKKLILVTCHRRENHGAPLANICEALLEIAEKNKDVKIVFPVHLNPNVQKTVNKILSGHPAIHLIAPLDYPEFAKLMQECSLMVTDSGGVQEEAPYFKKPIFVMRESTERPEGITAGVAELVGSEKSKIVSKVQRALDDEAYYQGFQKSANPYGDGHTSERILKTLTSYL